MPIEPRSSASDLSAALRRRSISKLADLQAKQQYPPAPEGEAQDGLLSPSQAEMGHYGQLDPSKRSKPPRWVELLKRKPVLVGVAALLVLVWFFSTGSAPPLHPSDSSKETTVLPAASQGLQGLNEPPTPLAADKDPSASFECVPIKGMPEHQYALVIDAGSTGSRIHVYEFAFCQSAANKDLASPLPTLKNEIFVQTKPGLSSYSGKPVEAAESLRPLLDEAIKAVPKSEQHCTPIVVKATAGLRLLGRAQSDAILQEVKTWLSSKWPFSVSTSDAVVIMDGKDEGVYAWITINYLLGLFGGSTKDRETAAVMDLGGASTQIVFEPSFPDDDVALSPGDHVYELSLPTGQHTLYQHSHLGYGLMQARRAVHNLIAFTYVWQSAPKGVNLEWEDLSEKTEIPTPCLVKDGKKKVTLDPPGRSPVTVTFVGTGAGFDACRRVVDVVMAKDALCEVEPCAFGGVYQPKLMETFGKGPIYALSYFYDRIVPLGLGVDSADFSIAELRQLTQDVCLGPNASAPRDRGWNRFKGNKEAMDELEDRPEYCLDLTFMHSLLNLGYELSEDRQIRTGKRIQDVELGWALGAGLALIGDADVQCTV